MGNFSKFSNVLANAVRSGFFQQSRNAGGHHVMHVTASKWSHFMWKDLAGFYFLLGVIPAALLITYQHIFIGPATLKEMPEGYVPKEYEYYQYPIQRFLAKYVNRSYQELYETELHSLYEEDYKRRMKLLEKKVGQLMKARADYKGAYYIPMPQKYLNTAKKDVVDLKKREEFGGV